MSKHNFVISSNYRAVNNACTIACRGTEYRTVPRKLFIPAASPGVAYQI